MRRIILDLCGGTGSWARPYEKAGYDVVHITLPDYDVTKTTMTKTSVLFIGQNGAKNLYVAWSEIYGILAAPPCTEFSIAKNRDIPRNIERGMTIVNACMEIVKHATEHKHSILEWWALENPAGLLHHFMGAPKLVFQPWWYGDPWTKRTMIWGYFDIPKRKYYRWEDVPQIEGLYVRPTRMKPSIVAMHKSAQALIPQLRKFKVEDDAAFRAITPPSFAKAFFEANP